MRKDSGQQTTPDAERQIVAMHLGEEVFGIDIAYIHTVITPQPITQVPQTPDYVKGVMNLRGRILPVIDLRTRFRVTERAPRADYRIVIVDVQGLTAGLIVDSVSEVLRLPANLIEPPSELLASAELDLITGIGRMPLQGKGGKDECFILLLDVLKVLTSGALDFEGMARLQGAA